MECAICNDKLCYSQGQDCTSNIIEQVREEADKHSNAKLSEIASILEARDYMKLTRLEETIKFAQELKFDRIGIAFCIGLSEEARVLHDILIKMFRVSSVCCKVGGINKKERGLPNIKKERYESICNPIGQAFVLNDKNTEMNIILGLCVGHDMLFTEYSKAPVTTLVCKDRILAHNPIGALTSRYYVKKFIS